MSHPAARVTDMHTCPMQTPGVPPIPHVGGPILPVPPLTKPVLIAGLPAATVGSMCTCVGPPDNIVKGSTVALIGGKPAARMGDTTAHGGVIVAGCPQVMIGDSGSGDGGGGGAAVADATEGNAWQRRSVLVSAAQSGAPFCEECERARLAMQPVTGVSAVRTALQQAAQGGTPFCEECERARLQLAQEPAVPLDVSPGALRDSAASGDPFSGDPS